MEVQFNQTIDITITHHDEVYCRITRGVTDGKEVGDTWLSMPLDVSLTLEAKLHKVNQEAKQKLNEQINGDVVDSKTLNQWAEIVN